MQAPHSRKRKSESKAVWVLPSLGEEEKMGNSGLKSKITHQILGTNFPDRSCSHTKCNPPHQTKGFAVSCVWDRVGGDELSSKSNCPSPNIPFPCLSPLSLLQQNHHKTGQFQQQVFASHSSGAWKVNGQGMGRLGVWRRPTSWFFLLVSSQGGKSKRALGGPFNEVSNLTDEVSPLMTQRPHLLIPSH